MKRPTKVMVLGVPFKIEYVEELKDAVGETEGSSREIKICLKGNPTPELLESTLLHEICHAALYVSGQSEFLKDKQEEALVLALENALAPLYKRRV